MASIPTGCPDSEFWGRGVGFSQSAPALYIHVFVVRQRDEVSEVSETLLVQTMRIWDLERIKPKE